jgi:hypothetical protein
MYLEKIYKKIASLSRPFLLVAGRKRTVPCSLIRFEAFVNDADMNDLITDKNVSRRRQGLGSACDWIC